MPTTVGSMVKDARKRLRMSQSQFGVICGISPSNLQSLEQGRKRYLKPAEVKSLAKALYLTENEFRKLLPKHNIGSTYTPLW